MTNMSSIPKLCLAIFALWENHLTIRCLHRPLVSRSSSSRNLWPSRQRRPWWWPKPCQWRRKWQTCPSPWRWKVAASKSPWSQQKAPTSGPFLFYVPKVSGALTHLLYNLVSVFVDKCRFCVDRCRFYLKWHWRRHGLTHWFLIIQ